MKHCKAALSLAFCALLLFLPCRAYAAGYAKLTAEISFSFRNESSVSHTCTAVIEPIDGAPAPQQTQAEVQSGGDGRFTVCFSEPGKFQYRIYQTNKDKNGVVYDDRVYTVTVAVRDANDGGLAFSVWATSDGEEKVDSIEFVNRGLAPEGEPVTRSNNNINPPPTGGGGSLDLYCKIMVLSALLLFYNATVKKYRRKAGDGI